MLVRRGRLVAFDIGFCICTLVAKEYNCCAGFSTVILLGEPNLDCAGLTFACFHTDVLQQLLCIGVRLGCDGK
jgi:hypothetical protein